MLRPLLAPLLALAALAPAVWDATKRARATPLVALPGVDYPARFVSFRPHLVGVRAVSYVIDPSDFTSAAHANSDAMAAARARRAAFEMYLAQRALAPTYVRPDPDAAWIVVNYRDRTSVPADWRERGLDLIEDPGNGAILFHLKGK
ncbi:MAG: hypothetical protein R3F56_07130 [Planctomycetota bacterium]